MLTSQFAKPLSHIAHSAGIPFLTPEVSPGSRCPMRMATVLSREIEGLSSLLVGMPECATYSRLFSPKPHGSHGEQHWLYVLDSREIVFGCREGVMNTLRQMDREGVEAILVVGTCVPDLIGEDFEGMLIELQPELRARLAYTLLGQFKNIGAPAGSWKTMAAMAQLMRAKKRVDGRVNILGYTPVETHIPEPSLLPLLSEQGVALRCLAPGSAVQSFMAAPDAALNIVVSPYMEPLAQALLRQFDIPFISLHTCLSARDIDCAYAAIESALGVTIRSQYTQQYRALSALEAQTRQCCEGKRYAMALRVDLPLPLTAYCVSVLGMYPVLLHIEEFYPEDKIHARQIKALGVDPLVTRIVKDASALDILVDQGIDLGMGYLPGGHPGMPWVSHMFDLYGQVGYERTTALLHKLGHACDVSERSA